MYKKVLYTIKKIKKKCGWRGWGNIRTQNTLYVFKKKLTKPGLEPMTSGLEKPALLSTRLNTIIGITKYE